MPDKQNRNYHQDLDNHLKKETLGRKTSHGISRFAKKFILESSNFYIYSSSISMLHRPQNRNLLLDSTRAHFSSMQLSNFIQESFYASKHYIYHCTRVRKKVNRSNRNVNSIESDILYHKSCVIQHMCESIRGFTLYIASRNLKHSRVKRSHIEDRAENIVERISNGLNKIAYMPSYLIFSNQITIENTEHNLEIIDEAIYILNHSLRMFPESYVIQILLSRLGLVLNETRQIIESRKKVQL
jgi:hypothetical protein